MISVYSVLYTLVLFSELNRHLVAVALPATNVGDAVLEKDDQFLGDEPMTELAGGPSSYRRNLVMDANEDGNPKVIIISDLGLKGHSIRGLNSAFSRSLPLLSDRSLSHVPSEHSLKIDRRNTDLDMLRCMIGRVYRPCWEE